MSVCTEIPGKRKRSKRHLALVACLAMGGISGCGLKEWVHNGFKVGPNYCPPVEPVAAAWIDYQDPRVSSSTPRLADWWNTFNDPTLDQLVRTAHFQNLTLREAGARILEFRARRNFAVGTLFPQLQEAAGGFSHVKTSSNVANPVPNLEFNNLEGGLNASWELDFWGKFRRGIEAADAGLDASIENYDDVLVLLLAEVATAYTDLRTFQQRLRYAQDNVSAQERSLEIAELQLKNGTATELDVQQARTVLEETRSLIPASEAGVRLANNQLCVLLGTPPRDLTAELGEGPIPTAAPEVALGIPADLVRRRPDVRRAERELAAQSARIGLAKADLYPHLGLNGSIGVAAQDFDGLFDGSRSTAGGFGPFFRWDILNYGRLTSLVDIQDARFEQLLWAYQDKVLVAGREAEDGVVGYLRGQERVKNLAASAAAAERARQITVEQYQQGIIDFTPVFIASSVLATQQDSLAAAQGTTTQSLIALYRALGGGWEIRLNSGTRTTQPAVMNPPVPIEAAPPAVPGDPAGELVTPLPDMEPGAESASPDAGQQQ